MAILGLPKESDEQKIAIRWLRALGYTPMMFANEQGGNRRFKLANYRKAMGLEKGAPDFVLLEPSPSTGEHVAVEMKRKIHSKVRVEQKAVHEKMRNNGWTVVVGFGFDDAKEKLEALGYGAR